ncbi:MAG: helix-turn-helix domain-containing protein [Armatimonadia bacterium]|nr:helix-turn-helix domain-containing protein [Armatimonadia bacterium]
MDERNADETKRIFAERLEAALERAGMTRMALADALGYATDSSVRAYVLQVNEPKISFLRAAARVLGVSADYLLGLDDEPGREPTYSDRLTEAARQLGGGQAWAVMERFEGRPGDERKLTELLRTEDEPIGAALYRALEEAPTVSGVSPWELLKEDHSAELERALTEDPEVTVGEARLLADALRFHGGTRSARRTRKFYRDLLETLRRHAEARR